MFCSLCPEVDVNEAGHNRSWPIAILKKGKTIRKAPIMDSIAVDLSISENETSWKLQR